MSNLPDWNNLAEVAIQSALGAIPEVGGLLSGLVGAFWPSENSGLSSDAIWNSIKGEVDAAINQAIDQNDYDLIQTKLTGLKANMDRYLSEVKDGVTPSTIIDYFIAAQTNFDNSAPTFQMPGKELLLSPLFSKMAQMHIALLRDGVLFGRRDAQDNVPLGKNNWGMDETTHNNIVLSLTSVINGYVAYSTKLYKDSWHSHDPVSMPQWIKTNNLLVTEVMNYAYYWPYMDVTTYPQPIENLLAPPYEIFQGPIGLSTGAYYQDGFATYDLNSQGMISAVTVWGRQDPSGTKVAGLEVVYGRTPAPLMGPNIYKNHPELNFSDGRRDSAQSPIGGVFLVDPSNPIVNVFGWFGDIIDSLGFKLLDGTVKGSYGSGQTGVYSYPEARYVTGEKTMVLSSIILNQGINDGFVGNGLGYAASGAIFGFRDLKSYPADQRNYAPQSSSVQGAYSGTVTNSDGDQGNCTLVIFVSDDQTLTGIMTIDVLGGAGVLQGTQQDNKIEFTTTDINWSGFINGNEISGTYTITGSGGGAWQVTKVS
ncbi:MAG TPA: insecticidal delta-endotoxin Cry8Ea1 family protein [Pyrinomonadaceae bacterium]|nr:insecticidal delta-endotoxin Cry8Ea1 family protein [Pyrinomonadaceae bacterium]